MENQWEPDRLAERIKIQAGAIEKLQKHISDRISRILQFMNLYFVFQGMVFSYIVSSSSKINCKVKWIPFTLSLLVSIFNFLAVWENINTSLKLYEEVVNNLKALHSLREQELQTRNANGEPQHSETRQQTSEGRWEPHSCKMRLRIAVSYLTLLLLFVFMGVMLCGCFQIECVITAVVTKD